MTGPIAFLFPGQGAQEVGMGRDLLRKDPAATALMSVAADAANADLEKITLRGPARVLADTVHLQPAMTAICLSLWRRLTAAGIIPAAVAGHSVGELSALAASGMATPENMVRIAAIRGRLMGEAARERDGAMAAVQGVPFDAVQAIISGENREGGVAVGAVNGPDQVVLTGDIGAVAAASAAVKSTLGAQVTLLRVSGAWHSDHMISAVQPFRRALASASLKAGTVPMVFNHDGDAVTQPNSVPALLSNQLTAPVRWDQVMASLIDRGIKTYVEVGPGKVLRGLVRLNDPRPEVVVHNVSDLRSLERVVATLTG